MLRNLEKSLSTRNRNCVSSTLLCWSLICLHKNHRKKEKNHNKPTLQMPGSFVTSQPLISLEPVEVTDRSWNSKTIQKHIIYGLIWPSSFSSLTKKDKALDPCINYLGLISTAVEGAESVRDEKMLAQWACTTQLTSICWILLVNDKRH